MSASCTTPIKAKGGVFRKVGIENFFTIPADVLRLKSRRISLERTLIADGSTIDSGQDHAFEPPHPDHA